MSDTSIPTNDLLLQHVGWLRGLAHSLVRDADLADDLTQEVVVRALEQQPQRIGMVRGWLATVLRNLVSERHRRDRARESRERASARPEPTPPTDELVERLHVQRQLAEAIYALEEPFRTTVLLRFYENLPPRKIAARQGVPVATVKSRLHRGLAMLRTRLDESYGSDRRAWVCALLPLANRIGPVAAVTTVGGIAVNTKLWIIGAAALVVGAFFAWPEDLRPQDGTVVVRDGGDDDATRLGRGSGGDAGEGRGADAKRSRVVAAPAEEPAPKGQQTVRGRIVDGDGLGVTGLPIRCSDPGRDFVTSGTSGWFSVNTDRETLRLEVADAEWVTVRAGHWRAGATIDPIVVAARALSLSGHVVDESGNALADAEVSLSLPSDFRTRFTELLDASFQPSWSAGAEDDGTFSLERLPAISGATLFATCEGFEPKVLDLPLVSVQMLEFRLACADASGSETALHGRVVRPDGSPASRARVACGTAMTRTNDRGFFAFDRRELERGDEILAVEPGYQPATQEQPDSATDFVTLQLGEETRRIAGRVVGAEGEPVVGAKVLLADPSRFGVMGMLPLQVEGLAAGKPLPPLALESATWQLQRYESTTGSARPVTTSNAMMPWVSTDTQGRFEIEGLQNRSYRIRVIESGLGWEHVSDPIPAGVTSAEVRVPEPDVWPEVRGRVVTHHGDPVPRVSIVPYLPVMNDRVQVRGGKIHLTRWFQTKAVVCDDEGVFVMKDVPMTALQFFLINDQILPFYAGVEAIMDPTNVVVSVQARAHIDVELSDPSIADAISVDDHDGSPAEILQMRADGHSNGRILVLEGGKSGIVTVTSDATVVNLIKDGEVVDSVTVRLRPGVVERIRR